MLTNRMNQPAILDRGTRHRQWKKIILMIKQDEIAECLQRASHLNMFLARLTEQNRPISSTRRPLRKGTRHYKQIRAHAVDLYEILHAKFPSPPTCRCALNHEVNIRLEFRTARSTMTGCYFHLAFTFEQSPGPRPTPAYCDWHEMQFQPYDNLCAMQDTQKYDLKSPKKVGFCLQDDRHTKSITSSTYQEIVDLCTTVSDRRRSTDWFGVVADCTGKQHRMRAVEQDHALSSSFTRPETISLSQVLAQSTMRLEHKSRLGLKLASSVMQLHTTLWLSDYWGADDIFFVQIADDVNLDHPLVRRNFGTKSNASLRQPQDSSQTIPCLFSLAVVLIELWYCKPFESLKNDIEIMMASQVAVQTPTSYFKAC